MYPEIKGLLVKIKEAVTCITFSFQLVWKVSKIDLMIRILLISLLSLFPVMIAWMFKVIINTLVAIASGEHVGLEEIGVFIALYVGLEITQIVVQFLRLYFSISGEDKINRYIDDLMVTKLNALDLHFFEDVSLNDQINNVSNNRELVKKLCEKSFYILEELMTIIVSFSVLLQFNGYIAVGIIILSVPAFIYKSKYTELFYWRTLNESNNFRRRNYLRDLLMGKSAAFDMRLYNNLFPSILSMYQESWSSWMKERHQMFMKSTYHTIFFDVLFNLCTVATFIVAITKYFLGNILVGDIQYYVNLTMQNSRYISSLFEQVVAININIHAIKDFQDFLQWQPQQQHEGDRELEKLETIEFKQVSFKYPDTETYILKDMSFKLYAREKTSLVGLNGCGKTTLVKLLLRFYDPTEGQILVNGYDIRSYKLDEYRERFGVLFQDYVPYCMSIKENIILADLKDKDNEDKIEQAVQLSGLESVINHMDKGIDTQIGTLFEEDGIELSGGQLQKVAVARAYFRESDLVILDEPSAALDALAEHHLFSYFIELCKNRGAILISHRLANVIDSDRILFIKDGRVAEKGSHSVLMKASGDYARLFNLQAQKYI